MTRRATDRQQLQTLYDQVPDAGCRGKCWDTCTSFPIPRAEKRNIRRATGVDLGPTHHDPRTTTCPLLTPAGQCGAYDVRPLICRIWGASRLYPCNYGCRPTDPPLSMRDTYRLLAQAYTISGQHHIARLVTALADLPDETLERMTPVAAAFTMGKLTDAQARARLAQLGEAGR